MNKNICVVLGTARAGNLSEKISKIIFDYLKSKEGYNIEFIDVKNFLFGNTISSYAEANSSQVKMLDNWKLVVEKNELLIFVVPEYNHSYPGELKILIDTLYNEYSGKIAGIASVSTGPYAGVRVVETLNSLLRTVNFRVLQKSINVPHAKELSDEGIEKIKNHTEGLIEEFLKH